MFACWSVASRYCRRARHNDFCREPRQAASGIATEQKERGSATAKGRALGGLPGPLLIALAQLNNEVNQ